MRPLSNAARRRLRWRAKLVLQATAMAGAGVVMAEDALADALGIAEVDPRLVPLDEPEVYWAKMRNRYRVRETDPYGC